MIEIDDLWDRVTDLIYNKEKYVTELDALFRSKLDEGDFILDVCAGAGFPALDLFKKGYNVESLDGTKRMVELYNEKAENLGMDTRSSLVRWDMLPGDYFGKVKVLMCRGNSLIYAGDSWGQDKIDVEHTRKAMQDAFHNFYKCLQGGGMLYVDKFRDDEGQGESEKGKVGEYKLIWKVEHNPEEKYRRWILVRELSHGKRFEYPNRGYLLKEDELIGMLKKAGFKDVEKVCLDSEKNFSVFLAYK